MQPWHSVFREADGSVSSVRFCMILVTVAVVGLWLGLSIAKRQVLDLPLGLVAFVGLPYGVKGWQAPHESDGPPPGDK